MAATKKCIVGWGQSNWAGTAPLSGLPAGVLERWTGITTLPVAFPVNIQIPGINFWHTKQPTTPIESFTDTVFTTGPSTVTFARATPVNSLTDRWVYIAVATAGQGQHVRVASNTVGPNPVLTMSTAWAPIPNNGATLQLLTNSHVVSAVAGTLITKTSGGAIVDMVAGAHVGQWMTILSGVAIAQSRKIVANTTTTVTVDTAFTAGLAANDGFYINSSGGISGIADYTVANSHFSSQQFYYDQARFYATGYEYPSHIGLPVIMPLLHLNVQPFGPILELSWQTQTFLSEPLYVISLGIGASYLSRFLGQIGVSNFSWFNNGTTNDWHPSSTQDLFYVLTTLAIANADAWLKANVGPTEGLDIIGFFSMEGESDALDSYRANSFASTMSAVRDAMRTFAANGYSSLSANRIPWIMGGVRPAGGWPYAAPVNNAMQQLAADDPYTGYVPTDAYSGQVTDQAHYDAPSQVRFGLDLFNKWADIRTREASATVEEDGRSTLAVLMEKTRRRYERQTSSNDAKDSRVIQFLNDSVREIYNTLGANCWFLRRVESATLVADSSQILTLPRVIRRLYRIERAETPGIDIPWRRVAATDEGRVQIAMAGTGGQFLLHHILIPRDMTGLGDVCLVPTDYEELVVVLACRRLAESAGNREQIDAFEIMLVPLWKFIKRDAARYLQQDKAALDVDNGASGFWPAVPMLPSTWGAFGP